MGEGIPTSLNLLFFIILKKRGSPCRADWFSSAEDVNQCQYSSFTTAICGLWEILRFYWKKNIYGKKKKCQPVSFFYSTYGFLKSYHHLRKWTIFPQEENIYYRREVTLNCSQTDTDLLTPYFQVFSSCHQKCSLE